MSNLLETFEKQQIEKLTSKKRVPAFRPGDTLKVTVRITEGSKSRLQAFEGICIARKNNSVNSNFTVRKISHGEGVERVFPLFSPLVEKIEVVRKGDVRRAKLYYLRELSGKKARIADKDRGDEADQYEYIEDPKTGKKKRTLVAPDLGGGGPKLGGPGGQDYKLSSKMAALVRGLGVPSSARTRSGMVYGEEKWTAEQVKFGIKDWEEAAAQHFGGEKTPGYKAYIVLLL